MVLLGENGVVNMTGMSKIITTDNEHTALRLVSSESGIGYDRKKKKEKMPLGLGP